MPPVRCRRRRGGRKVKRLQGSRVCGEVAAFIVALGVGLFAWKAGSFCQCEMGSPPI